jgi:hypothetical protein
MRLSCPNCHYHIIELDQVKETQKPNDNFTQPPPIFHPPLYTSKKDVKKNEAVDAQGVSDDALTTADKVRAQELHDQGYSYARIRQMLGKKVPITAIMSATRLDKGK